jgi:hypothetical protein
MDSEANHRDAPHSLGFFRIASDVIRAELPLQAPARHASLPL